MRRVVFAGLALSLGAPALAAQPAAAPPPAPAIAAPADPERFAVAERLVALIMPEDAVRRMLSQGFPGMDLAMEMGAEEARNSRDPHFRERMRISMRVTGEVLGEMMVELQPLMVRASADYFARQLTLAELNEMVRLFSTPAGNRFAEAWLGMAQDPAFTEMLRPMIPRMIEITAQTQERIRAATAHLAPPLPPLDAAPEEAPEAGANEGEQ